MQICFWKCELPFPEAAKPLGSSGARPLRRGTSSSSPLAGICGHFHPSYPVTGRVTFRAQSSPRSARQVYQHPYGDVEARSSPPWRILRRGRRHKRRQRYEPASRPRTVQYRPARLGLFRRCGTRGLRCAALARASTTSSSTRDLPVPSPPARERLRATVGRRRRTSACWLTVM